MKRKILTTFLALCMVLTLLPTAAFAADPPTLDLADGPIVVTASGWTQGSTTVVHDGAVTITGTLPGGKSFKDGGIIVSGGTAESPVRLTLKDAAVDMNQWSGGSGLFISPSACAELILEGDSALSGGKFEYAVSFGDGNLPGIQLNNKSSLTISGDGSLTAKSGKVGDKADEQYRSPAIGGPTCRDQANWTLTINGGDITADATQSWSAPGIGSGTWGSGGNIIINGGTVTAKGGKAASAIGEAWGGTQLKTDFPVSIDINGGTINAYAGGGTPGTNSVRVPAIGYNGIILKSGVSHNPETLSIDNAIINIYAEGIGIGTTHKTTANIAITDSEINYYHQTSTSATAPLSVGWAVGMDGGTGNITMTGCTLTQDEADAEDVALAVGVSGTAQCDALMIDDCTITSYSTEFGPSIGARGNRTDTHIGLLTIKDSNVEVHSGCGFTYGMENGVGIGVYGGTIDEISFVGSNVKAYGGALSGPAIGAFDGVIGELSIDSASKILAVGNGYSSAIGRNYNIDDEEAGRDGDTTSPAFPIVIEDGAEITAYAYGDLYHQKDDETSRGAMPMLSAIDQDCIVHEDSDIAASILMGDFKNVLSDTDEVDFTLTPETEGGTSYSLTMPAGYASFAQTVPADTYTLTAENAVYQGDAEKRSEENLTPELLVADVGVSAWWMLQPVPVAKGTLEISKKVSGTGMPDASTEFEFTIVDADGNAAQGKYSIGNEAEQDIPENGAIQIKAGETASLTDLPVGEYAVTEAAPAERTYVSTQFKVDNGSAQTGLIANLTIAKDTATALAFTNIYKREITPSDPDACTATLIKADSQDSSTLLSGAKFELYRVNASGKDTLVGTYTTRANGKITANNLSAGSYYWMEISAPEGYKLDSSKHAFTLSSNDSKTVTVSNVRSDVPEWLNGIDHYAYVIGYSDGNVHPEANITRAEVATIFFRLLTDDVRDRYMTKSSGFSDVKSSDWFCTAVSTMAEMGIVNGYTDGTFNPNGRITRAEFAAIAARFDKSGNTGSASFSDIYGHWAQKEIGIAANNGWILGYTDGSFRPDQLITRAEAMTMVNRVLQRVPELPSDLLSDMVKWPDNMDTSKWYYLAVQEATNSHEYERKVSGYETWTALRPVRDWAELEK